MSHLPEVVYFQELLGYVCFCILFNKVKTKLHSIELLMWCIVQSLAVIQVVHKLLHQLSFDICFSSMNLRCLLHA